VTFYYQVRSVFIQLTIEVRSDLAIIVAKVQISRPHELKLDWETYFKDMPQFWIAIFFVLLAVAELYQSLKDIDLPLPVYLGLGTILAIASNYQQQLSFDSPNERLRQPDRQINPLQSISSDPALNPIQTTFSVATQPQDLD
jgi:hypothetical protein